MHITPFLSGLLSSSVNSGYFVTVNKYKIRIKISDNEFIVFDQSPDGELHCFLSRNGVISSMSKQLIYDYLFDYDEYGIRFYS